MSSAHGGSITLLDVPMEYREGAPCSTCPEVSGQANVGFFVFQMPKNLKRYVGKGDLHFVTFSCYRRLALLGTARSRNVFIHALREVRKKYGIQLVGYVL